MSVSTLIHTYIFNVSGRVSKIVLKSDSVHIPCFLCFERDRWCYNLIICDAICYRCTLPWHFDVATSDFRQTYFTIYCWNNGTQTHLCIFNLTPSSVCQIMQCGVVWMISKHSKRKDVRGNGCGLIYYRHTYGRRTRDWEFSSMPPEYETRLLQSKPD